jgi:hypothetical protein
MLHEFYGFQMYVLTKILVPLVQILHNTRKIRGGGEDPFDTLKSANVNSIKQKQNCKMYCEKFSITTEKMLKSQKLTHIKRGFKRQKLRSTYHVSHLT